MLGDGQPVNVFKLFLVVREKGGYHAVSKNGLWDLVAKESGLGLNVASSVKLVYVKYLDALERLLVRVAEEKDSSNKSSDSSLYLGGYLIELGSELKGGLSESKKMNDEYPHCESMSELKCSDDGKLGKGDVSAVAKSDGGKKGVTNEESLHMDSMNSVVEDEVKSATVDFNGDKNFVEVETKSVVNSFDVARFLTDDEGKSVVVESDEGKICTGTGEDVMISDSGVVKEEISHRKRKRESTWGMLDWVNKVAENPCDPVIGSLPERSKWKSYSNGEFWKQVISFREAVFLKRQVDSVSEKSFWQKNQKMHPCMYDDHIGSSYNFRERSSCAKNLLSGKMASNASPSSYTGSQSDFGKNSSPCMAGKENDGTSDSSATVSVFDYEDEKKIPLGPYFQAEVPEWTGVASESDSKWLGTQVWPLVKKHNSFLIERDPIGKGRQDSCGCQIPASIECVRFHIAEKRLRVKRELGSAFLCWKFDKMGEEVTLSWTEAEQKKFNTVVRLNPSSLDRCFWDQILKVFRTKSREELVSYYYNVFLLQRRAFQNRSTPDKINSDDESESESATNGEEIKSPRSIFRSPKKPHKRFR